MQEGESEHRPKSNILAIKEASKSAKMVVIIDNNDIGGNAIALQVVAELGPVPQIRRAFLSPSW